MCCNYGCLIPTIFFSLAIAPSILLICGIAEGLRILADKHVPNREQNILCKEAIASFEMCANALELGVVADYYDLLSYLFYLIATSVWYTYKWKDISACPYIPLEEAYEGTLDQKVAAKKVAAQLAGGFLGLYYINLIYSCELLPPHRCRAWSTCCNSIRVSFLLALFVEALFTCAYRLLSKYINNSGVKNANLISCLAGILLVLVGREFSTNIFCYPGGNLNPVLSTVTKFNCRGVSPIAHVFVYWVGPCLGSIASLYAYPYLFK